ncbi:MAG: hypothetical protein HN778_09855 [Prolixibacteraceae bacterium]|jgi:hypothetical protein|nr:hypothetical protein [Prolixibacteraceae bacterium]MBT6007325.1 hypothetical protein [Prolixibacteraceae bacterium]MBT6766469.1 hypothetical protein [Prolixibacteraceae bacterium]MBT7000257.1 hypothetical protein [Prolixibacteraceae bacterium]MBT7395124.1 hypothetical protein [Prolixibacteraceae bacterium]
MKIKRLAALSIIMSLSITCISQNSLDILYLSGRYGFPQSYENTYNGEASEFGTSLSLTVPVPISQNTIWYNSLNHFYFSVDGDPNIPVTEINPITLNGFILRTGLYQKFGDGKGIQLLFAPRFMTDFKNADGNCFQLGGVFMYENVFSKQLTMSFGAMFNQELFGPYVVPIVNLSWQLSEKWYIKGLLPVTLKINYLVNENLTIGFSHFGLVTSYYLGDEKFKGDYIERQCIDLSLFARQKLFGNFYLEGKAGRTFGRGYKQFAGDQKVDFSLPLIGFGDERIVKNVAFKDGFFIDMGIVYNIKLPE